MSGTWAPLDLSNLEVFIEGADGQLKNVTDQVRSISIYRGESADTGGFPAQMICADHDLEVE